jgi:hypothetical protein
MGTGVSSPSFSYGGPYTSGSIFDANAARTQVTYKPYRKKNVKPTSPIKNFNDTVAIPYHIGDGKVGNYKSKTLTKSSGDVFINNDRLDVQNMGTAEHDEMQKVKQVIRKDANKLYMSDIVDVELYKRPPVIPEGIFGFLSPDIDILSSVDVREWGLPIKTLYGKSDKILTEKEAMSDYSALKGRSFDFKDDVLGIDGIKAVPNVNLFCQYGDNLFNKHTYGETSVYCTGSKDILLADGTTIKIPAMTETNLNNAYSILCNKVPGDKISPAKTADHYYFNDPSCVQWCSKTGGNCIKGKRKQCNDKSQWPEVANTCKDIWKDIWDNSPEEKDKIQQDMQHVCGDDIINSATDNIFTPKGCGNLCNSGGIEANKSLDLDYNWCNDKRSKFCGVKDSVGNYPNMFTDKCLSFCKLHPAYCETSINGACKSDVTKAEITFKLNPDGTPDESQRALYNSVVNSMTDKMTDSGADKGEWCGCAQSNDFYKYWRGTLNKQFLELGVDLDSLVSDTQPVCENTICKGGGSNAPYRTPTQLADFKNCKGDCINVALTKIGSGSTVGDLITTQDNNCTSSQIDAIEQLASTDVDNNIDANIEQTLSEQQQQKPLFLEQPDGAMIGGIVGGILGAIILLLLLKYVFFSKTAVSAARFGKYQKLFKIKRK